VPMKVRVVALPERRAIPLIREPWIGETVRGIEVHATGDGATGHVRKSLVASR